MFLTNKIKASFTIIVSVICLSAFGQSNSKFKVVLDAGHGGKDYGAIYHGFIEKNIALSVALKVGKILEKDAGTNVIYTRKTDVFIELTERPNIANKANANFFVSIHCNAAPKSKAYGAETFVIGLTKNASNLEVAKQENSVITLESDYKLKYVGFDPNSPESMIGLTLLQEEYIDQSITLASKIQDGFTNDLGRKNRGVKQAPFWVLHKTAMPSVLIELGFLSYQPEGEYLSSEEGQDSVAKSIADAILSYKKEYYGGSSSNNDNDQKHIVKEKEVNKPVKDTPVAVIKKNVTEKTEKITETKKEVEKEKTTTKGIVFKVQISASGTKLELKPSNFKGLSPISSTSEKNIYKYMYGETNSYSTAKQQLQEAKSKGFDSAFIIAFKNGNKISVQEALKE
ncbi:N-acetylmuramoyl-L-alanine amidase family protein [Flavobacterium sp. '19STA2R22 D10 B1']|uniref:N-acetylmuramoyl-L-alanine amidase family protein n=1 Tax=Flavobacterium aerium TaxID=3037261 RepID=UPI00278BF70F|nr:N-acetylmuramoyl-L-alanine amidase [Flavobacterium sp. '19STA2R22 D10 B1']